MKKLILIRHGKSSWEEDLPDHERPLKKRAYKDARLVLDAFQNFVPPNLSMWSSHAERALTTAKLFKDSLQVADTAFQVRQDLYTFDKTALLKVIRSCDDSVESLMVFGHNPAMTGLANKLGDQHFSNIPTTGLCLLEFKSETWQTIEKGKTLLYLFPKNLR